MSSFLAELETVGATVLETLASFIAPLAASKNPAYAPAINGAATALQAELSSIAAGNPPTLHSAPVAAIASSVVAGVATAVEKNNPALSSTVASAATTVESAVNAAL